MKSQDDLIEAEVICNDIPNCSDRIKVWSVIRGYHYLAEQNTAWLAKW